MKLCKLKNFQRGETKWDKGVVTKCLGSLNYLVKVEDRIKKYILTTWYQEG